MSILSNIIDKLKGIVGAVEQKADEVVKYFEKRRAEALAAHLDALARNKPYKNWRTSSQDLAYLVGEDGSFEGRAELWDDLNCHGEYKGNASQNLRLHAALLDRAASDGVPWPDED